MAGKKVTHSEEWWAMLAPPTVLRCSAPYRDGSQCRREAIPGGTVCRTHGGSVTSVKQKAAARIGNAADEMVKRLQAMLDDPSVESRDKVKIMHDMLDRAGLNATNKVLLGVTDLDPVEALFRDILADPSGLANPVEAKQLGSGDVFDQLNRDALRNAEADDAPQRADIVDAEVIEDASEDRTPAQIDAVAYPAKPRSSTPKHIREAMERELRTAGLW